MNKATTNVMKQKTIKLDLSPKEAELINLMRNYKRAYPNGSLNLYWSIQEMVDELINPFEQD